jgi:hypothetical protein
MDKNQQTFTKGLQEKYGVDNYVQEMQELKFELNQNKETDRKSKFTPQEKMKAISILSQQKKELDKQMTTKQSMGGSITKNRMGGNDYRKGGYVLNTTDNRKVKRNGK